MRRKARPLSRPLPIVGLLIACALGSVAWATPPPTASAAVGVKRADAETANLTVAIEGPGPVADVGVPFTLSASLGDAIGPFVYIWTSPTFGTTHTPSWTLRLTQTGPVRFALEVGDAADDIGWANATVNGTVGPSLAASGTNGSADVSVPTGVSLTVAGGVPPYRLVWRLTGSTLVGTANLSAPGRIVEPVWTTLAGPLWMTANVTDAVNGTGAAATWVAAVHPDPLLSLGVDPPVAEVGAPLDLIAGVTGGVPPLHWAVSVAAAVRDATPPNGTLASDGDFGWNATATAAGTFPVSVLVTDAVGVATSANLTVTVVPPVNLTLALVNTTVRSEGSINVSALIGGGVPPFAYLWQSSTGPRAGGTLRASEPINWSVPAGAGGFVTVTLTVLDGAGGVAVANVSLLVAAPVGTPPPPPATGGTDGLAAAMAVGVSAAGAAAVVAFVWQGRRRRRRDEATRRGRADALVVDSIRARQGIDADELQGLGDAHSLFPEEIEDAVHRQVAAGRVRAEYETGEPVYHWVATPDATSSEERSRDDSEPEAP